MKKLMAMCAMTAIVTLTVACEANTSSNIDVESGDLKYIKDASTGLCFALTASRKSFDVNSTGIAMANVPCSEAVLSRVGGR